MFSFDNVAQNTLIYTENPKKLRFLVQIVKNLQTTKIKKSILQSVYNRGVGAWKSNIASVRLKSGKKDFSVTDRSKKMSKEQWGQSRVYSFVVGGRTSKTADNDLFIRRFK